MLYLQILLSSPEPLFRFLIIWMMCSTVCLLGECSSVTAWYDAVHYKIPPVFQNVIHKKIKSTCVCYNRRWKCCACTCLHSYYDLSELQFTQSSSWRNSKISLHMSFHSSSVWEFMLQTCSFKLPLKWKWCGVDLGERNYYKPWHIILSPNKASITVRECLVISVFYAAFLCSVYSVF